MVGFIFCSTLIKNYTMNFKSLLFCLALVLFASCSNDDDGGQNTPQVITATVSFNVTTSTTGKPATISYTSSTGQVTLENQTLPWNVSYTANFNAGSTISLQANSSVPGDMTATISVDGQEVQSGTDEDEIELSTLIN